jgi:hypothetical protein
MDWTDIVNQAMSDQNSANRKSLAGDFANIMGSFIDYSALKRDLRNTYLEADNIQLQAKQQANQIRQQYLQAAGNYQYAAARRGIDVNSASVRSNLEGSAEAMGKDIQRLEENAYVKSQALRTQAKIAKQYGKAEHIRNVTGSIMNMGETAVKMFGTGGAA